MDAKGKRQGIPNEIPTGTDGMASADPAASGFTFPANLLP